MEKATKKEAALIYIDRNSLTYYRDAIGTLLVFPYPQEIIRDLDVLSEDALKSQLKAFITANKIPAANISIILAEGVVFEKVVQLQNKNTPLTSEEKDETIQRFIDTVPFESVAYTKVPSEKDIKVIAANSDFFTTIMQAFEQEKFSVTTVLPASVFGKEISFAGGINQTVAKTAFQKADTLKQYNLLVKREGGIVIPQAHQILQDKQTDKKRLFLLVGVFIFLIIVLVIVIILSMGTSQQSLQQSIK